MSEGNMVNAASGSPDEYQATVARVPEHALPWHVAEDSYQRSTVDVCSVPRRACVSQSEDYMDAAYIVHACNAYPRLVEALRRCESAMTYSAATVSPGNRQSEGDRASIHAGRAESSYRQLHYGVEDIRLILRELGEL